MLRSGPTAVMRRPVRATAPVASTRRSASIVMTVALVIRRSQLTPCARPAVIRGRVAILFRLGRAFAWRRRVRSVISPPTTLEAQRLLEPAGLKIDCAIAVELRRGLVSHIPDDARRPPGRIVFWINDSSLCVARQPRVREVHRQRAAPAARRAARALWDRGIPLRQEPPPCPRPAPWPCRS